MVVVDGDRVVRDRKVTRLLEEAAAPATGRIAGSGDPGDLLTGPQTARLLGVPRRTCGASAAAAPMTLRWEWHSCRRSAVVTRVRSASSVAISPSLRSTDTAGRPGRVRRDVDGGEILRGGDDARRPGPATPLRHRVAEGERHRDRPSRVRLGGPSPGRDRAHPRLLGATYFHGTSRSRFVTKERTCSGSRVRTAAWQVEASRKKHRAEG